MKSIHSIYLKLVFAFALFIGGVGTSFSQYSPQQQSDKPEAKCINESFSKEEKVELLDLLKKTAENSNKFLQAQKERDKRTRKHRQAQTQKLLKVELKRVQVEINKSLQRNNQLKGENQQLNFQNTQFSIYILLAFLMNICLGSWLLIKKVKNKTFK